jgi:hypothetical protein
LTTKKDISKVKTFDHLIGNPVNDTFVTEDMIESALNKCIGDKRRKTSLGILATESDAYVIQEFIEEEDVIRAIVSINNLKAKKPDTSIKFDDVRNMELGLDLLEGYKDAEKQFVQSRLSALSEDFNLEKSTDKFWAWRVALCELKIMQLETLAVMNHKEFVNVDGTKQLDLLDKQYKVYCDSLNILKRQRDNIKKVKEDRSTISDQLNEFDKPVEELQHDVESEEQEELRMLKNRKK